METTTKQASRPKVITKMPKVKQITLYNVRELQENSPSGFEYACEKHADWTASDIPWSCELLDSLKATIKQCDYSLDSYSLGLDRSDIKIGRRDTDELTGARAFAWLENTVLGPLRIPFGGLSRSDSKRRKNAKYGERAGTIPSCPLTGICFDHDLLDSLNAAIADGQTVRDAVLGLAYIYQHILQTEFDYLTSEEGFIEHCEANDYMFDEHGKLTHL